MLSTYLLLFTLVSRLPISNEAACQGRVVTERAPEKACLHCTATMPEEVSREYGELSKLESLLGS